ncbi:MULTISPECIES: DMT family transporter [Kitasatospora]|uniref:DMT family transporter n=1 Tax=Kitasatospora cystarginea TaxID=58350 RepID=A0ABN3DHA5_9ACTN
MQVLLPVLFALCAALSNALAVVLQRVAALSVPRSERFRLGLMWDLLRRPVWLGGILAVIAAAVFQASALATGAMTVVQPLFVVELPLALIIASRVLHRRMPPRGWMAVGCVVAGLAVAMVALSPSAGVPHAPMVRWVPALVGCGGAVVLLSLVALRRPVGRVRAGCLGAAAAIGYALTAALMKSAMYVLGEDGVSAFFLAWQTYAFALAGVSALFLFENAMQAGPLVASQPALTLGDALVSLALGVTLYDERVRGGWWLAPALLGAALVAVAAVTLARIPLTGLVVAAEPAKAGHR